MLKTKAALAVGFLTLAMAGCAHDQSHTTSTTTTRDPVVQRNTDDPALATTSLVVNFENGQRYLTQTDKANISELVDRANFDSGNDRVEVAVWSDNSLPSDGTDLGSDDRKLASDRAAQIKNFLRNKYNITSVKTYNMAEQSNWVARAFNTRDAELKSLFSKEEAAPMSDKDFYVIKTSGAASKAVLVISHK